MVVSNIFYFHPYLGKISILTNVFQMGWNHQLEIDVLNMMAFVANYRHRSQPVGRPKWWWFNKGILPKMALMQV